MLSLIILMFFAVMALAEWIRSRLLVRAGVRFDEALNGRIFRAGFRAELEQSGHNPSQALADLTNIRQFLTGNGTIAFFDAPWTPVYIAVSFMLHPCLGWLSIFFVVNLVVLAIVGQRLSAKPADDGVQGRGRGQQLSVQQAAQLGGDRVDGHARRSAPALGRPPPEASRSAVAGPGREPAHDRDGQVPALYAAIPCRWQRARCWRSTAKSAVGSMIAANVLMSRASQPIEVIVSTWSSFLSARSAYGRIGSLLDAHPDAARRRPHRARRPARSALQGRRRHRAESRRADPEGARSANSPPGSSRRSSGHRAPASRRWRGR